jgi:hypothetical protein
MKQGHAIAHEGIIIFSKSEVSYPRGEAHWIRIALSESAPEVAANLIFMGLVKVVSPFGATLEGGQFGSWSLQYLISSDEPESDLQLGAMEAVEDWVKVNEDIADYEIESNVNSSHALDILETEFQLAEDRVRRSTANQSVRDPEKESMQSTGGNKNWWEFWK